MKESCQHKRIKKNYPFGKKSTAQKTCKDCGKVITNKELKEISRNKAKNKIKYFIPLLIMLSCFGFTTANLVIDNNPISINTKINQENNYTITVNNNHTFDILDVEFKGLNGFTFPSNIEINSKQTKTINFQVKTNESFHGQIQANVEFKFLVDLPEEVTNYNLYVSNSGIDNQYLTIRQGDTVTFTNEDSITHRINVDSTTLNIAPNSTQTKTFSNIGTFHFYDINFQEFSFFNGDIEVISRTEPQKVHNPTYDQTWTINLESNLNPTNLTIENSQADYNVTNKKSKNGQLTIKNIGTEKAELVTLTPSVDWVVLDKDKFDIEADDTNWVGYTILPYFFNTSETDKTYTIDIKIKASNTEQYTKTIKVYVPYQEITEDFSNDYEYLIYMDNIFCPKRPCSAFCSPELPECQADYINGSKKGNSCTLNLSEDSWYQLTRENSEIKDSMQRLLNAQTDYQDGTSSVLGDLNQTTRESYETALKNSKKQRENSTVIWSIIIFSILTAMTIMIFKNRNLRSEIKTRITGNTTYKEN